LRIGEKITIDKHNINLRDSELLFPTGLLQWAGHGKGGVRKPFKPETGRPLGEQIITPLIHRLNDWVQKIVRSDKEQDLPRALLLVGGPGNGKTDAVESCIEQFDEQLAANGKLVKEFASRFNVEEGSLPPRKATVDVSSFWKDHPSSLKPFIELVQDATEKDLHSNESSPEETLLDELVEILNGSNNGIYICCVNRGILANASMIAHAKGDEKIIQFLDKIVASVTSGVDSPECWPLNGFSQIATWPMDVESLVDSSGENDGKTVVHQILKVALDEKKWVEPCSSGPRCPFCQNRKLLDKPEAINNLVNILHYYELATGRRWTFRDIFSLIPYILIGDNSDFESNGKSCTPCEWAANHLKMSNDTPSDEMASARAPYLLVSRLYYNRLFPRWPRLDSQEHRKAKKKILPRICPQYFNLDFKHGYQLARNHYRNLAAQRLGSTSSVGNILHGAFSEYLDPAIISGSEVLFNRDKAKVSASDIEERFSLSVSVGLKYVSSQIEPIERDLIDKLAQADDALSESNYKRLDSKKARLLQASVRQYCARLVKRSIGVRKGVCNDSYMFKSYANVSCNPDAIKNVRKQLSRLLQNRNTFKAQLATTFGQPVAQRDRNIALITKQIKIKQLNHTNTANRPTDTLPYLLVQESRIPITFPLFKALNSVDFGLQEASLPEEIFALLDGVKSMVSGQIVRDKDFSENDVILEIGAERMSIEVVDGRVVVEKEDSN